MLMLMCFWGSLFSLLAGFRILGVYAVPGLVWEGSTDKVCAPNSDSLVRICTRALANTINLHRSKRTKASLNVGPLHGMIRLRSPPKGAQQNVGKPHSRNK